MTTPITGNTCQWPLLPRSELAPSETTTSLPITHTAEDLQRSKPQEMVVELDRWNSAEGICYAESYDSDFGSTLYISTDPEVVGFVAQEKAQYEKRTTITLKKFIGGTAIMFSEPVGMYRGGLALEKYAVIATNMIGIVVISAELVLGVATAWSLLKLNDRVNKQKREELKSRLSVAESTYVLHDTGELTYDLASHMQRILRDDENPRLFWEGVLPNIMSIMELEQTLQAVNNRKRQLETRLNVLGSHDTSIVDDLAACEAQRLGLITAAQPYLKPIAERLELLDSQAKAESIEQRIKAKSAPKSVEDVYIANETVRDFCHAVQSVLQHPTNQSQASAISDARIGIGQLLSTVEDPSHIRRLYESYRSKYSRLELPEYEEIQNIVAKSKELR